MFNSFQKFLDGPVDHFEFLGNPQILSTKENSNKDHNSITSSPDHKLYSSEANSNID